MASTKTIVKKVTRRRGTVSLTKVRKAVDIVYARYTPSRSDYLRQINNKGHHL
jgi:hypothetical protein